MKNLQSFNLDMISSAFPIGLVLNLFARLIRLKATQNLYHLSFLTSTFGKL